MSKITPGLPQDFFLPTDQGFMDNLKKKFQNYTNLEMERIIEACIVNYPDDPTVALAAIDIKNGLLLLGNLGHRFVLEEHRKKAWS